MTHFNNRAAVRPAVFLVLLCSGFFLFVCAGVAQASREVLIVVSSGAEPYQKSALAMQAVLELDNIKSRIISVDTLKEIPADLLKRQFAPVLWVAVGSRATNILNGLLSPSVPLVYCMVADPSRIGIDSERKHVAGVSVSMPVRDQFAVIQKGIPGIKKVGMLYNSSSETSVTNYMEARKQLPEELHLIAIDISIKASMADAIQEFFREDIDIIWTSADSSVYDRAAVKSLLLASLRHGVPVFGFSGSFVKAGALIGLQADPVLQGQYAAALVLSFLGLKEPQEYYSSGVSVSVNTTVADRLGIVLSQELFNNAYVLP